MKQISRRSKSSAQATRVGSSFRGGAIVAITLVSLCARGLAFGPVAPPRLAPQAVSPAPLPPAPVPADKATPMPPSATPPLPASKLSEARLHFQQGVALFQDQNYDASLAEFEGAYAISKEPIVLYNMGLTYKALFRYPESIERLTTYLDEAGARVPAISREKKTEVEKLIAEMKSLLADVTVVLRPAGAAVTIDGRPVRAHGTACQQPDGSWRTNGCQLSRLSGTQT